MWGLKLRKLLSAVAEIVTSLKVIIPTILASLVGLFAFLHSLKSSGTGTDSTPSPPAPRRIEDSPIFRRLGFKEVRDTSGRFISNRISSETWKEIMGSNEHVRDGYVDDTTYAEVVDFARAVHQRLQNDLGSSVELAVIEERTLFTALHSGGLSFFSGGVWVKKEEGTYSRFIQVGGPQSEVDDRLEASQRPSRYGKKPIYILLELKIPQNPPLRPQ